MRRLVLLFFCSAVMVGCTSKLKKENDALKKEIAERKQALKEHLRQGEKEAQEDLAVTDSLLEIVSSQYDEMHKWVMEHATELDEQSPEVVRLNQLRARRDSLKERFEVLAEAIKFIRHKQNE